MELFKFVFRYVTPLVASVFCFYVWLLGKGIIKNKRVKEEAIKIIRSDLKVTLILALVFMAIFLINII